MVDEEVRRTIESRFKDQRLVDLETSIAVLNRIKGWSKIFAFFAGIPLALIILILAILGVQKYEDFKSKIDEAEKHITPVLNRAIQQAEETQSKSAAAQETAEDAQRKAADASRAVGSIVEQTKAQLTLDMNSKIQSLSSRIAKYEQTASQIEKSAQSANLRVEESGKTAMQAKQSSADVIRQVEDLKKRLAEASETIMAQDRKIDNTSELVKVIFSHGKTDSFEPLQTINQWLLSNTMTAMLPST